MLFQFIFFHINLVIIYYLQFDIDRHYTISHIRCETGTSFSLNSAHGVGVFNEKRCKTKCLLVYNIIYKN
jgi:hypothetical protein